MQTLRQVDADMPTLRAAHQQATAQALSQWFAMQQATLAPAVATGVLQVDVDAIGRDLGNVIFDRGKATATDYGRAVFVMLGRSLRFRPELLDPWVTEVAGNEGHAIAATMVDRLTDIMDEADPPAAADDYFGRLTGVRSDVYAVSMTTTFGMFGAHDGARAAGAGTKGWLTTSGNPRSDHAALNGERVGLADTFSNGMRWPGDPAGGAEQVANCVCALTFA